MVEHATDVCGDFVEKNKMKMKLYKKIVLFLHIPLILLAAQLGVTWCIIVNCFKIGYKYMENE